MNYGWHSSCSGSSCFADSRGFRRIHHKNTTASCFFLHPFVLLGFFQASIPSGHGAGQAFEAFFLSPSPSHGLVAAGWCWGSLGGTRDRGQELSWLGLGGSGQDTRLQGLSWHPQQLPRGANPISLSQSPPCNPLLGSQVQGVCFNTYI